MKTSLKNQKQSFGRASQFWTIMTFVLLSAVGHSTFAASSYWIGGASGNFTNAANWSGGTVPAAADTLYFTNNSAASVSINTAVTNSGFQIRYVGPLGTNGSLDMNIASGASWLTTGGIDYVGFGDVGTMTVSGGGQWLADSVDVGHYGSGTLTLNGGTNVLGGMTLAVLAGSAGNVFLTGGQLVTTNSAGSAIVQVGSAGVGAMTVSGGQWLANVMNVGVSGSSSGTLNLGGGTNVFTGNITLRGSSTGTVTMTGGQLVTTNSGGSEFVYVGFGEVGSMTVSGGQWLANNVEVGTYGHGILTLNGGTNVFTTMNLAKNAGSAGDVFLTGGQLVTTNSTDYVGYREVGNMTVSGGQWLANNVTLGHNSGSKGTLTLNGGTNVFTGGMTLSENSATTGTVTMTGGQLVTTNSGGSTIVYVGYNLFGNMTVSGGQWLANNVDVGHYGSGTLTLNGGTNVLGGMTLAVLAGSAGNVFLTGGQLVTTNSAGSAIVQVGSAGVGAMTVSGGQWLANVMNVGVSGSSSGTLNLGGGTNVFTGEITLRGSSTGTVMMTGGQLVTTNSTDYIGFGEVGKMTVSGGQWLANTVNVGTYGSGTLTLNGGTNLFSGTLYAGYHAGSIGTVMMTGGQLVTTNSVGGTVVSVGNSGVGTMTVSNGQWLADNVTVGGAAVGAEAIGQGTLTIAGGQVVATSVVAGGVTAASNNTVRVTSGGVLEANSLSIAANSVGNVISNSGGVYQFSTSAPTITPASGVIALNGGTISFRGITDADVKGNWNGSQLTNITFRNNNTFRLNAASNTTTAQDYTFGTGLGATNYVGLELINGATAWRGGSLTIGSGGTMLVSNTAATVSGSLTNAGAISVFNSGLTWLNNVVLNGGSYLSQAGTNTFNNGLTVASGVSFSADAASMVSVLGNYQNLGSSVFSNRYTVTSGNRYQSWGGSTNQFAGGLTIASGGGLDVTNGQSLISGTITNAGTMTVMNSRAIYQGNVVNLGAYVSDPSTNTFNGNFTVGTTGVVAAASNDVYAFGADFVMQSTNRAFDMHLAQIVFAGTNYGITTGNTNHTLNLAGSGAVDMGSNWLDVAQLATNFSMGTLSIASNNNLTVTGTKFGALTNALYVGWLDLQTLEGAGITTNNMNALTNGIFAALNLPDINLYYDKNLTANAYLGGLEYNLWGDKGLLIPIPEPSTMLAASAGLALLLFLRRPRDRKGC